MTPPSRAFIGARAPDAIVVAAAERRPDVCENDPALARALNVDALSLIATDARARRDAWVLSISTDYVFDGTSPPYLPDDPPSPLNAYGRSKLEGERALLDSRREVVRAAPAAALRAGARLERIRGHESHAGDREIGRPGSPVRRDGRLGDALSDLHARRRRRDPADARTPCERRDDLGHHAMVRRRTDDQIRYRRTHRTGAESRRAGSSRSARRPTRRRARATAISIPAGSKRWESAGARRSTSRSADCSRSIRASRLNENRGSARQGGRAKRYGLRAVAPPDGARRPPFARRRARRAATRLAAPCAASRRAPARRSR